MRIVMSIIVALVLCVSICADETSKKMQAISVTIKSGSNEGSGVLITRKVKIGDKEEAVNFVWTAGHVVAGNRKVRSIIDTEGISKKVVEFDDVHIVKELTENGRRVGELKMDAKILKYSDADNGEDLALLMVIKRDFVKESAEFYLEKKLTDVGTELFHCGSLLGQMGANSMTKGIMSQIGRVYKGKVYDQTTVNAFPGSSGGGVFIPNGGNPLYVGMVVRGSGETFNLMVPIRRMKQWAEKNKIAWALNSTIATPSMENLNKLPIEGAAKENGSPVPDPNTNIHFMDKNNSNKG